MCVGGREGGLLNFLRTIMYGRGRVKDKNYNGRYRGNWQIWQKLAEMAETW